jgi:ABC-type bacteriocin/lantibiotic exporter with double-glycine peptidase domain
LNGYTGDYASFRALAPKPREGETLASLADLANRAGYAYRPAQLTRSELSQMRSPVIIHEESEGIGRGTFSILLGHRTQDVFLVDGTSLRIRSVPGEDFLRNWTGYALIPDERLRPLVVGSRAAAAAAVGIALATFFSLRKVSSHRVDVNGLVPL